MLENLHWLGHASFVIRLEKTIYFDPWQLEQGAPADLILVTHGHRDHLSIPDIEKISKDNTTVVSIPACVAQLEGKKVAAVKSGDKITIEDISIEAIPAYNVNKFRSPGVPFHPKEAGGVGFVITVSGTRIYHAGDTDFTPEMRDVKTDIALLPVSGRAVMTAEEAVEAVGYMKPSIAIPMHYGTIMGTLDDAVRFKESAPVRVEILEKTV